MRWRYRIDRVKVICDVDIAARGGIRANGSTTVAACLITTSVCCAQRTHHGTQFNARARRVRGTGKTIVGINDVTRGAVGTLRVPSILDSSIEPIGIHRTRRALKAIALMIFAGGTSQACSRASRALISPATT